MWYCSISPYNKQGAYISLIATYFFRQSTKNSRFKLGGYSSRGRTTVCGTVSSLFNSGYPPF